MERRGIEPREPGTPSVPHGTSRAPTGSIGNCGYRLTTYHSHQMAKARKTTRTAKADIIVPPITVGFEEAVSKLLKVKPPAKPPSKRKAARG